MTDSRAAKRYARALFSASLKQNCVTAVDEDLNGLVAALNANPAFREFLASPVRTEKDKLGLLQRVFGGQVHELTSSLLSLIVKKGRESDLTHMQIAFSEMRRQHEQVVKAIVESAMEMDEPQREAVVNKIAAATGQRVEPEFRVDPALIGGVKVTYDNYVLDGTARGQLNRLRETLMRDLLKQS